MKIYIGRLLRVASAAFFVACTPALAQMGVPNHGVPVSHGPSSGGTFNSVGPCLSGIPIIGAGVSADPVCGRLPNSGLAQGNPKTLRGNPTAGLADVQDFAISGLTHKGSPDTAADKILIEDAASGTLKYCTVGECGTASGVNSVNGASGSVKVPTLPGGRCTLTGVSGGITTPITTADVTGATSLYYTPYYHDYLDIYDGSNHVQKQFSELTLALDSNAAHTGYQQSGKAFHVVAFINAGVVTLGTGVAWTGSTNPGAGAGTAETELFEGRLVNKNDMVVRYGTGVGQTATVTARQARIVCGIFMTANGVTEDSAIKRYVSNLHNAVERSLIAPAADASWTVNVTGAYAQANGNAANQFDYFHVVGGRELQAYLLTNSISTSATKGFYVPGIGINSTTVNSANCGYVPGNSDNTLYAPSFACYKGYPGIGKNSGVYIEQALTGARTAQGTAEYALSGSTAN